MFFPVETYPNPPKKNYVTNKSDVFYLDEIWSMDLLDLNDFGPNNDEVHRYNLVVIDIFSKFGWTVALKNQNEHTIDFFENILNSSKR